MRGLLRALKKCEVERDYLAEQEGFGPPDPLTINRLGLFSIAGFARIAQNPSIRHKRAFTDSLHAQDGRRIGSCAAPSRPHGCQRNGEADTYGCSDDNAGFSWPDAVQQSGHPTRQRP